MANFSGALKITDFNDFIAPSQDCIIIEGQSGTNVRLVNDVNKVCMHVTRLTLLKNF